jgi:hypothetical protein
LIFSILLKSEIVDRYSIRQSSIALVNQWGITLRVIRWGGAFSMLNAQRSVLNDNYHRSFFFLLKSEIVDRYSIFNRPPGAVREPF